MDQFAIGGATLTGQFDGVVTVYPDGNYFYDGSATINFSDTFTDPYDTFDLVEGEWNPDGTPYDITDSWEQNYSGNGFLGFGVDCP